MSAYHNSVLMREVIGFLKPEPGKLIIDATAGGGGHTEELIKKGASVLAIDRDPEAIHEIEKKGLKNLILVNDNFTHIYKIAQENGFEAVDGILLDLGVSSHQVDTASRGFSFNKSGPLDMRMDTNVNVTAQDIVNHFEKRRLNEIFKNYGQEKFSLAIADAICVARQIKPIQTTEELANIVSEVYRKKRIKTNLHSATKVFQALRVVVNSELLNLEEVLPQTVRLLKGQGRIVVISFHSLEDAIVKRFFKGNSELNVLTRSPVSPGNPEIEENLRSRSAKLRAAAKL